MCFSPKSPSLDAVPIENLGTYFRVYYYLGVYAPGPGELLYDGALSGLLALSDLFYPSTPITTL